MKIEITVKCHLCKVDYSFMVDKEGFEKWKSKSLLIQDALPYLEAAKRELLVSKTCGKCWDIICKED